LPGGNDHRLGQCGTSRVKHFVTGTKYNIWSMTTDEVSFGFEDFWPVAHQAFPKFWEVMPRLVDSMNSLLARGYERVDPIHKVTINLGILAATSLTETMTLVGNGLGSGAMKIARAMLECAINAEYLRRFPAELDDYLDWSKVKTTNYWYTSRAMLLIYSQTFRRRTWTK